MTALTDSQRKLLEEPNFAVVATLKQDGTPQTSVVWIDTDGEDVLFNTTRPRAKGRHLERDPRVSLVVIDRDDPYRYVEVEGRAELVDEGATEHIHKLSRKYSGSDFSDPENRVLVRVKPKRVHSYGLE